MELKLVLKGTEKNSKLGISEYDGISFFPKLGKKYRVWKNDMSKRM